MTTSACSAVALLLFPSMAKLQPNMMSTGKFKAALQMLLLLLLLLLNNNIIEIIVMVDIVCTMYTKVAALHKYNNYLHFGSGKGRRTVTVGGKTIIQYVNNNIPSPYHLLNK